MKPRLSLRQFFTALPRDGWYENYAGALRRTVKLGGSRVTQCPVTAVAMEMTGLHWSIDDPSGAAEAIGLRRKVAGEIATAADRLTDYMRPSLRRRLVRDLLGRE